MTKHKITECIKLKPTTSHPSLANWRCPKCGIEFQCGDAKKTTKMECNGFYVLPDEYYSKSIPKRQK
jgi:hypothetical protein